MTKFIIKGIAPALMLPESETDRFRFYVLSTDESKFYTIGQNKKLGYWTCSCMGYITHNKCKHLANYNLKPFKEPQNAIVENHIFTTVIDPSFSTDSSLVIETAELKSDLKIPVPGTWYAAVLIPIKDPIAFAYAHRTPEARPTLGERLPDAICEKCGSQSWWFLPQSSPSVAESGKPEIECMHCGFITHL